MASPTRESFRAAFGDADDGGDDLPEPADETDAETALEEWAEKWEREQWERRNASAPSVERGARAGSATAACMARRTSADT